MQRDVVSRYRTLSLLLSHHYMTSKDPERKGFSCQGLDWPCESHRPAPTFPPRLPSPRSCFKSSSCLVDEVQGRPTAERM
jgi:hypothetical protein